jgi:hypothetical protein
MVRDPLLVASFVDEPRETATEAPTDSGRPGKGLAIPKDQQLQMLVEALKYGEAPDRRWADLARQYNLALQERLSPERLKQHISAWNWATREDPLYMHKFDKGLHAGIIEGAISTARDAVESVFDTVVALDRLRNPVWFALTAAQVYATAREAVEFLDANALAVLALVADWPRTLGNILAKMTGDFVDGYFELTGKPHEQGRYVGVVIGRGWANLYLIGLDLIPGLQELAAAKVMRSVPQVVRAANVLADAFKATRRGRRLDLAPDTGVKRIAGSGEPPGFPASPPIVKSVSRLIALEKLLEMVNELTVAYRAVSEVAYLRHGDLAKMCTKSNGLAAQTEEFVSASADEVLRKMWPTDWREWRLNSHHVVEERFFRAKNLSRDIRDFFTFLSWKTEDDMWAAPLAEFTHIRKPATAVGELKDAGVITPTRIDPATEKLFLLDDYTTFSYELTRAIGPVGQYKTVEQMLTAYEGFYGGKSAHRGGVIINGGVGRITAPALKALREKLAEYRNRGRVLRR